MRLKHYCNLSGEPTEDARSYCTYSGDKAAASIAPCRRRAPSSSHTCSPAVVAVTVMAWPLAGAPREEQPCRRLTGRRTRCEDSPFRFSSVFLLLPPCPVRFAGVFCGRASDSMLLRFAGVIPVLESLGRVPWLSSAWRFEGTRRVFGR